MINWHSPVWYADGPDATPEKKRPRGVLRFSKRGLQHEGEGATSVPGSSDGARDIVLLPVLADASQRWAAAVTIVPRARHREAIRNGIPLGSGAHLLAHGDVLVLRAAGSAAPRLWISAERDPESLVYAPELHGEDAFCPKTQVRIKPGAETVRCPGTAARFCGVLYQREAWEMTPRCTECGYDSGTGEWQPPAPTPTRRSFDELLRFARA